MLTSEQIQYAVDKKTYQFQFLKLDWTSPGTHVFQGDDNYGLQHVIITLTNNPFARVELDLGYTTSAWYDCALADVQEMASVFYQKWGPDVGSVWQGTASLNGNYGPISTLVEIIGNQLLGTVIKFGETVVTPQTSSNTLVTFVVPSVSDGNYVITVNGTDIGTFGVRFPSDSPVVTYVLQDPASLVITITGDSFYLGETTIIMDSVTYSATVVKPTQCSFQPSAVLSPFSLTTPVSTTYYPPV